MTFDPIFPEPIALPDGVSIVGPGTIGRSVDTTVLTPATFLAAFSGRVRKIGWNIKNEMEVTLIIHPWDEYSAVPLKDLSDDQIVLGVWERLAPGQPEADTNAIRTQATKFGAGADPSRAISRVEETRRQIAWLKHLKNNIDIIDRTDNQPWEP